MIRNWPCACLRQTRWRLRRRRWPWLPVCSVWSMGPGYRSDISLSQAKSHYNVHEPLLKRHFARGHGIVAMTHFPWNGSLGQTSLVTWTLDVSSTLPKSDRHSHRPSTTGWISRLGRILGSTRPIRYTKGGGEKEDRGSDRKFASPCWIARKWRGLRRDGRNLYSRFETCSRSRFLPPSTSCGGRRGEGGISFTTSLLTYSE